MLVVGVFRLDLLPYFSSFESLCGELLLRFSSKSPSDFAIFQCRPLPAEQNAAADPPDVDRERTGGEMGGIKSPLPCALCRKSLWLCLGVMIELLASEVLRGPPTTHNPESNTRGLDDGVEARLPLGYGGSSYPSGW